MERNDGAGASAGDLVGWCVALLREREGGEMGKQAAALARLTSKPKNFFLQR